MKVIFNTAVSFANFGSVSSHRVVEIPEELVKPYLKAGIATEISPNAPIGLKIVGNPIPKEWLLVEEKAIEKKVTEKVAEKKSQSTKKKTKESVE